MLQNVSLILFISMVSLLSACTPSNHIFELPLAPTGLTLVGNQSNNLRINVSDQLPGPEDFGGSDGLNDIAFKQVIPWMKTRLAVLNYSHCSVAPKNLIILNLSLGKLYTETDSNTLVGYLEIIGNFRQSNHKQMVRYYNTSCEMSFFAIDETSGVQGCFNSAMSKIIPKINRDLCHLAASG